MKPIAVVQGIPRGKRKDPDPGKDLKDNVKYLRRDVYIHIPVGLYGYYGSGKKTLAYRFNNMEHSDPLNEVPVKDLYGADIVIADADGEREISVLLKLYIFNPWNILDCPLPSPRNWDDFCSWLIIFAIDDKKSFKVAPRYLKIIKAYSPNIKENFFIVGNKGDLRRTDEEGRSIQVSRGLAKAMATHYGAKYYECSALKNIDVMTLLIELRIRGMKLRYIIK